MLTVYAIIDSKQRLVAMSTTIAGATTLRDRLDVKVFDIQRWDVDDVDGLGGCTTFVGVIVVPGRKK